MDAQSKICKGCGTEKPLTRFYNKPGSKDGKHTNCIPCMNEYTRLYAIRTNRQQVDKERHAERMKDVGYRKLHTERVHAKYLRRHVRTVDAYKAIMALI